MDAVDAVRNEHRRPPAGNRREPPVNAVSAPPPASSEPTAPYLLAGVHSFDTMVMKFRERYNSHNPTLPIGELRSLEGPSEPSNLTCAASKINETLHVSMALEKGSGKIKTLQLTSLPVAGGTEKAARATASAYMASLLREFEPTISVEQSTERVLDL